jgi:peptidyl-prolyl cis-trans isomerase D
VQTGDGFTVAQVLEIIPADPDADLALLGRIRTEVEQAMAQDLETQFMAALRTRADVRVNPRLVDNLAQP